MPAELSLAGSNFSSQGLECIIGRGKFAVPLDAVAQILEFEVGPPPPLATTWVGGTAIHENRILISVALSRPAGADSPRRVAKWVRLAIDGRPTDWALEVSSVAGFVQANVQNRSVLIGQTRLPSWVTAATLSDGRSLGWIHVAAMLRDLAS